MLMLMETVNQLIQSPPIVHMPTTKIPSLLTGTIASYATPLAKRATRIPQMISVYLVTQAQCYSTGLETAIQMGLAKYEGHVQPCTQN